MLMEHDGIALVLATGGASMVRAAYRSGTPAIGVGPGNAPAYVAADADLPAAAQAIVEGKSFDNGIICGSEQHVVTDQPLAALDGFLYQQSPDPGLVGRCPPIPRPPGLDRPQRIIVPARAHLGQPDRARCNSTVVLDLEPYVSSARWRGDDPSFSDRGGRRAARDSRPWRATIGRGRAGAPRTVHAIAQARPASVRARP